MGLESIFKINGSAMKAQMMRMEVHSSNIANINSTRTPEGGPYRRKQVVFEETPIKNESFEEVLKGASDAQPVGSGVEAVAIVEDPSPFRKKFDPNHPDAGPDGFVEFPNVDIVSEIVDIQESARSYEANISVILAAKNMIAKTFEIGRN
jgi:flagellar basal-body rod protein FlgC